MEEFWSGFEKTAANMKDYFMSIGALGKKAPIRKVVSKEIKPPSPQAKELATQMRSQYGNKKYVEM